MNLEKAFGQILKSLRGSAKISQEALALECGLDRTYISLLERGLRQPSLKTVFTLSAYFKITPSQFIELVEKELREESVVG